MGNFEKQARRKRTGGGSKRAHPLCLREGCEAGGGCRALCSVGSFTTGTSPILGTCQFLRPSLFLNWAVKLSKKSQATVLNEFCTDSHYLTADRVHFIANPFCGKKKKIVSLITILQVSNLTFTSLSLTRSLPILSGLKHELLQYLSFPSQFLMFSPSSFFLQYWKFCWSFKVQFKWYPLSLFCFHLTYAFYVIWCLYVISQAILNAFRTRKDSINQPIALMPFLFQFCLFIF